MDSDPTEPVSPPARPSKRGDWRPKLWWFAAEIVVVAGVLIALALNAWWQGRQDAQRERTYLSEIRRDLIETETSLQEAMAGIGLSSVASDETLTGNGTAGSPLGLADDSVTDEKLAAKSVTGAKLDDGALVGGLPGNECSVGAHYQSQSGVYAVGFNDPAYFSRLFKQTHGVSPSQYRA